MGGKFPDGDPTPRAVVKEYWDQICPTKTIVRSDDMRKIYGDGASAVRIYNTWLDQIRNIEDPCLEVERFSSTVFSSK